MPKQKQLQKKILIQGEITTLTGLHIGGTNTELSIGGMDNAIIRDPLTFEPYIPGSSLKGKMRSLTELAHNTISSKGMNRDVQNTPTNNPEHLAAHLFGYTQYSEEKDKKPEERKYHTQQPSRVIVRDCRVIKSGNKKEILVEQKAETVIDRITSAAMPRQMERVPKGTKFEMTIVLNVFSNERSEEESIQGVLRALQLVEDDYLGGAGSRGSGQVSFAIHSITARGMAYYKGEGEEQNITGNYSGSFPELFATKTDAA